MHLLSTFWQVRQYGCLEMCNVAVFVNWLVLDLGFRMLTLELVKEFRALCIFRKTLTNENKDENNTASKG